MSKTAQCPICSDYFDQSKIEAHAATCVQDDDLPPSAGRGASTSSFCKTSQSVPSPSSSAKRSALHLIGSGFSKRASKPSPEPSQSQRRPRETTPEPSIALDSPQSTARPMKRARPDNRIPLAERMRPTSLETYIGHEELCTEDNMALSLIRKGVIRSMILWGPPGCGKTSLANVINNVCKNSPQRKLRFVKLSAAMAGVADVKKIMSVAAGDSKYGNQTVLFVDEIHRFNKSQQDSFLHHLEIGTVTLVGATTENPSFSLNAALLSRCSVVKMEKLTTENLMTILVRAVKSSGGEISNSEKSPRSSKSDDEDYDDDVLPSDDFPRFTIDTETIRWLAETCDGDARIALGGLETAMQWLAPDDAGVGKDGPRKIDPDVLRRGLKKCHVLYDRQGDQHYSIISALHKSVRASDENASIYWLARMLAGGEDPVYIARRLVRAACEDIGLEDTNAFRIAIDTMHGCKMLGMPECDVLLAQCVTYLARAPKSRLMEDALRAAQRTIANHRGPMPSVPLHLQNAPTSLMKNLGYGRSYNMLHKDISGLTYMPEGMEDLNFFRTSPDRHNGKRRSNNSH